MKIIRKSFIAIIVCIYSYCNAQPINTPAQWLNYQKNELKKCPYIFEGKITEQNKIGESTCSVIQITKIYKGNPQIKLGTIKIITTILAGSEAFPQLSTGNTYIIFGSQSNSNDFQSKVTDNSITLWCNDWVLFVNKGAEWGWKQKTQYKTLDSLNSFFRTNGVIIQEQTSQAGSTQH
jgi:hypothetical protein